MADAATALKTILTTYTSYAKSYIQSVLPTKVSQLTNDSNFITNTDTAAKATADAAGNVIADTYAKSADVTTELAKKANAADVPTTASMTTELAKKANKATTLAGYGITDTYTKTDLDTKLSAKADKATTLAGYSIADAYTKTEVDTALAKKLDTDTAASTYVPVSTKGAANGIATLDAAGQVPSSQLPSYVDDVIEGYYNGGKFYKEAAHTTEIAGETGKIYIDIESDNNKSYRYVSATTGFVRIDNAVSTSDAAVHDGAGNVISDTYAKKTDLSSYLLKTDFNTFIAGIDDAAIQALWKA